MPGESALCDGPQAYFQDAWRAPLRKEELGVTDIFQAVLGRRPWWMTAVLIARNGVVRLFGLETASVREMSAPPVLANYRVGDKIGPWPIYGLTETELVAGRDNGHLDFRVSVLKRTTSAPDVVISTVCHVHNRAGKAYLWVIKPFHRFGVRALLRNAVRDGRL